MTPSSSLKTYVARGVLAGLGGAAVMTGFQKLVEMPITGRADSYAPQQFAEKILPVRATTDAGRKRLNYATHFALGATWGAAYGVAAYKGLRGTRAIVTTFAAIYLQDVVTITALGLDKPWAWSRQDAVIDVVDKFVNVVGTGLVFDNVLAPVGSRASAQSLASSDTSSSTRSCGKHSSPRTASASWKGAG